MDANKAYFMVRSQVANEADRQKFDHWYVALELLSAQMQAASR